MPLVVTLYILLVAVIAFAPLRWSIVAFLLLSTIDFPGERSAVGVLNAAKGIVFPAYLLWRLRRYSGHRTVILAPFAWSALVSYAAIAAFWSIFPVAALKLTGHMAGSLLICFVFLRATKAGVLSQSSLLPVSIGTLLLGILCFSFAPNWTGEAGRFTSFMPAQGYASFLGALFCLALCSKTIRPQIRVAACAALATALILNGSRIWFFGILVSSTIAFLLSDLRIPTKIFTLGGAVIIASLLVANSGRIAEHVTENESSNRILAAISALYKGDSTSQGLGTLHFRRTIDATAVERIKSSSLTELVLGHGTSNAAVITGSLFKNYSGYADPNRMLHDEWLRIFYEWGIVGFLLWCISIGSIAAFALQGLISDAHGNAKALVAYLPPFLVAFAGENFLAGAGSAMSVGFLLLIGIAGIAHREAFDRCKLRMRALPSEREFHAARVLGHTAV